MLINVDLDDFDVWAQLVDPLYFLAKRFARVAPRGPEVDNDISSGSLRIKGRCSKGGDQGVLQCLGFTYSDTQKYAI